MTEYVGYTWKGIPVATKAEITVAITDGIDTVVETFSGLSDEQLDTAVYEDGWTAREVLAHLAGRRWRLAIGLTIAMTAIYLVFILLIAYDKPLLARILVPGLSLGILLGTLVIATAWVLIVVYVRWTNRHYDEAIARLKRAEKGA